MNESVRKTGFHFPAGSFQFFSLQFWTLFQQTANPFILYVFRPKQINQTSEGKPKQEIT